MVSSTAEEDEQKEPLKQENEESKEDNVQDEDVKEEETEQEEALFDPPLYRQRYSAVADIINKHSAKFIIDMGCSEGQFISKVKDMCPCVEKVVGVDLDMAILQHNSNRLKPLTIEYILKREHPLTLSLYCGSISEPDIQFRGADVIACIEIIEHLYNDTLDKVPHALFGILAPKIIVITTPNCEYNILFDNFSGMRHWDHKFEWTRKEFEAWCSNIVGRYPYDLEISGIGDPPADHSEVGYCSQMAIFTRNVLDEQCCIAGTTNEKSVGKELTSALSSLEISKKDIHMCETCFDIDVKYSEYKLVSEIIYPFDDKLVNRDEKIINETEYIITHFFSDISDETEETFVRKIPVEEILLFPGLKKFSITKENFLELVQKKYTLSSDSTSLLVNFHLSDFARDSFFSDGSDDFDLDGEICEGTGEEEYGNEADCDEVEEVWD